MELRRDAGRNESGYRDNGRWELVSDKWVTPFLVGASLCIADAPGPLHEILEQLMDILFGRVVREVPVFIKALGRIADHHLRTVEREHVQKNHRLAEMILRARRGDVSDRRAHDRRRFPFPRALAGGREAQSIAFLSTPGTE
jgi:hypothetical protein